MNAKVLTRTTLTERDSESVRPWLGGDSEGTHLRLAITSGVQTRMHRDSCSAGVLPRPTTSDATAGVAITKRSSTHWRSAYANCCLIPLLLT